MGDGLEHALEEDIVEPQLLHGLLNEAGRLGLLLGCFILAVWGQFILEGRCIAQRVLARVEALRL